MKRPLFVKENIRNETENKRPKLDKGIENFPYILQNIPLKGHLTRTQLLQFSQVTGKTRKKKLQTMEAMDIEKLFHMTGGIGNTSYAKNSHLQVLISH